MSVAGADLNQAAAPPVDTAGATTGVAVGTHLAHVNPAVAGAVYKPVACTECHTNNTSGAHSNGVVNVTFAAATGANLGSYAPTFVQGNGTTTQTTCATYCHGSSLNATTTRGTRRLLDLERRRRRLRQLPQVASRAPPTTTTPRRSPPARSATAAPSTPPASSTSPAACT